jgi:hypothetical protein
MKPGFHLWMLKSKSSKSSGCIHIHTTNKLKILSKHCLPARKLMTAVFWKRKGVLTVEFMKQRGNNNVRSVLWNTKKLHRAIQNKKRGMLTYSALIVLLHENACPHASTAACWSISTGSYLTILLTALILLRVATTCLPIWKTGWDHST